MLNYKLETKAFRGDLLRFQFQINY